jgi:type II secretion system (T2SS) protein E
VITDRQLQEAIQHQVLYGGRLGTSLYELGFITEERLTDALARAHGVPAIDLKTLGPEAVSTVPKRLAQRYKVFPCKLRGQTLFLGMVDPGDHAAVAQIGYSLGFIVRPVVVPEFRMVQLLHDHYDVDERWRLNDTHAAAAEVPQIRDPDEAAARIDAATSRDEVVSAALALGHCFFKRVLFFIVREPWVLGWDGVGEGVDRAKAAALRIPLDLPSVFQSVTRNRTMFVGRPGPEETNKVFLEAIGKRPGTTAAVFPVALRSRVVNLMWGDSGTAGAARGDLGGLLAHMQKIPRAYLRIIRQRIAESRARAPVAHKPPEPDKE